MITFTHILHDVELQITADDFFSDESVGVPLGPESLEVEQLCPEEDKVILTNADYLLLSRIATEKYMEQL